MNESNSISTVISGSYRKHLEQLYLLKSLLQESGIEVLSPIGFRALNPQDEFVILDADPVKDPKLLQDSVFAKIRRSAFLTLANIDGYLGPAALVEVGYAIAQGLTIYTVEPVLDPNLAPYCRELSEIHSFPLNQLKESVL